MADLFPGSDHVHRLKLDTADDLTVRVYAAENDFVIVTKDADYSELQLLLGSPPKVIWVRRGNCSTQAVELLLRKAVDEIESMVRDETRR